MCRHGAVGFPIWFGLAGLDPPLDDDDLKMTGFRAQIMLFAAAHVVPLIAASFLVRLRDLARSWVFVLLSIWAATVPAVAIAYVSTDFSTLIGGMIAVLLVGLLAHFHIGLSADPGHKFDLPPLEAAVTSDRGDPASPGTQTPAGSTHIVPLKRRPTHGASPVAASSSDLDAMLAPGALGDFHDGARRGDTTGPAAVSGVPADVMEDDLFTTADGADSSTTAASSAAGPSDDDATYRAYDVGRWKVYSSDREWGAKHSEAIGEGCEGGVVRCEDFPDGVRACAGTRSPRWRADVDLREQKVGSSSPRAWRRGRRSREAARWGRSQAVGEGWTDRNSNGGVLQPHGELMRPHPDDSASLGSHDWDVVWLRTLMRGYHRAMDAAAFVCWRSSCVLRASCLLWTGLCLTRTRSR